MVKPSQQRLTNVVDFPLPRPLLNPIYPGGGGEGEGAHFASADFNITFKRLDE